MSLIKRLFDRQESGVVADPDVNHYYVALINEARSEDERIALGRAAQSTMRLRRRQTA